MHWRVRALVGACALLPLLVGCGERRTAAPGTAQGQPSSTAPASSTSATAAPSSSATGKKPPDSQESAGPCDASQTGDVVSFAIQPDVPQPRCVQANGQQHLKVINSTNQQVLVRLGRHELTLAPSEEGRVDDPFGTYLEAGVHVLFVSFYAGGNGPELWLRGQ